MHYSIVGWKKKLENCAIVGKLKRYRSFMAYNLTPGIGSCDETRVECILIEAYVYVQRTTTISN